VLEARYLAPHPAPASNAKSFPIPVATRIAEYYGLMMVQASAASICAALLWNLCQLAGLQELLKSVSACRPLPAHTAIVHWI
jgi:hypothetical protein